MRSSKDGRPYRLLEGALPLLLVAVLVACEQPVQEGPPLMADVEDHLGVAVGWVPEGCDPVGLGGDGRGGMFGAGFECPRSTTLRIERFDGEHNDDPLSESPLEAGPGLVEWRDEPTGDVMRVVSDGLDIEVLLRVGESIEVRDRKEVRP